METAVNELKAKAYNLIRQIDQLQGEFNRVKEELVKVNQQINQAEGKEKKAK